VSVVALAGAGGVRRFVDIDATDWHVPGGWVRKARLRSDIQPVAWALLREDVLADIQPNTLLGHFRNFRSAGEVFGGIVPSVLATDLDAVQRSWLGCQKPPRHDVRLAMQRIIEAVGLQTTDPARSEEYGRIVGWLVRDAAVAPAARGEEFLTRDESVALVRACGERAAAGRAVAASGRDLLSVGRNRRWDADLAAMVDWAIALGLMVAVFTGLRRESLIDLRTDDWRRVLPGICALRWRHPKSQHDMAAVVPEWLADELDLYVGATAGVREALNTDRAFFAADNVGRWSVLNRHLSDRIRQFAERVGLVRGENVMPLSTTALRRTYVTNALLEGRDVHMVMAQLGHARIGVTYRYARLDQIEHERLAGGPLDRYARISMMPEGRPVLLADLRADERERLLQQRVERDQSVGLCSQDRCVKLESGRIVPCTRCELLVTGAEFIPAWETEIAAVRERLASIPVRLDLNITRSQIEANLEAVEANLGRVRAACP